jgi:pSer/pThr/pTyr-binding forkhead associated (FHA) protein
MIFPKNNLIQMMICPSCSNEVEDHSAECPHCGQALAGLDTESTKQRQSDPGKTPASNTWGDSKLGNKTLVMLIAGAGEKIKLPRTSRIVLGRADAKSAQLPDIDLAPYNAIAKGVSRFHAAIEIGVDFVTLTDLNSRNGTSLNGAVLVPHQPRIVRDGDQIGLGDLIANIYFVSK